MKKTINFLAALALAAGMSALAPSAAAGGIQWMCFKNDSWLLMRGKLTVGGKKSRQTRPTIAKRTACIRIPQGASRVKLTVYSDSLSRGNFQGKNTYLDVPRNSRHTHMSVNVKTNWWGNKIWFSGGPWQWTDCGKCDYYEF